MKRWLVAAQASGAAPAHAHTDWAIVVPLLGRQRGERLRLVLERGAQPVRFLRRLLMRCHAALFRAGPRAYKPRLLLHVGKSCLQARAERRFDGIAPASSPRFAYVVQFGRYCRSQTPAVVSRASTSFFASIPAWCPSSSASLAIVSIEAIALTVSISAIRHQ